MNEAIEEEVEEQEEEECPKCPPVGAPAWMATFADMATLLMAFFVLILSFAEFNVPKFKQISGTLREAFGVQKVVPVVEQPAAEVLPVLQVEPGQESQEQLEVGVGPAVGWGVASAPGAAQAPECPAFWGRYTFSNFASR